VWSVLVFRSLLFLSRQRRSLSEPLRRPGALASDGAARRQWLSRWCFLLFLFLAARRGWRGSSLV